MKIFVCEFITGGGLYREALHSGLLREGLMMRDALLSDLAEISEIQVTYTCDKRIDMPLMGQVTIIDGSRDIWQVWLELIKQVDAVFVIAPESAGVLLRLAEMVIDQGKLLLGCMPSAIQLTTSKIDSYKVMKSAGIPAVASYSANYWLENDIHQQKDAWVVKPNDGVGCEDVVKLDDKERMISWLKQGERQSSHIVQPFHIGIPASLSMLCRNGQAWLLSCNRQKVSSINGRFQYEGSVINDFAQYWPQFEVLAGQIAKAIPDLNGYIGVDLMVWNGEELKLEVLEINPRFTTSYVGLHAATGLNIADEILKLSQQDSPYELPRISKNKVEITL